MIDATTIELARLITGWSMAALFLVFLAYMLGAGALIPDQRSGEEM